MYLFYLKYNECTLINSTTYIYTDRAILLKLKYLKIIPLNSYKYFYKTLINTLLQNSIILLSK